MTKKQNKLIIGLAGLAITSTALYGFNDRLRLREPDSGMKSSSSEKKMNLSQSDYEAMQQDNALKPVQSDISSKREVDDNPAQEQAIMKARYTVSSDNKAKSFPANAKPGECYGELVVPAQYEMREERIEKKAAYDEYTVTPAQYEWVEERVMTKEAETRLEIVPATYKTVEEKVLVEPKRTETRHIPATFTTEQRKVLVQPASLKWVDGNANIENKVDTNLTGDIVCLVETPAEYKTVEVEVIDEPARTETKTIPAEYKTVERRVVDVPAHTREVTVPAEYATVEVRQLKSAEKIDRESVQPQYVTVERYVETKPAYTEWDRVLCETSIKPALAFEIESRLKEKGFNPGTVDGEISDKTKQAVQNFQMENGLAKGGITPDTLRNLGIADFEDEMS